MDKCGTANNVYVGARYVPLIVGEWDANETYEPLTVVLYQGTSYTSRTYVPKGIVPSENTAQYWALTGNYNAQVEMYRQEVERLKNLITYSFDTTIDMTNSVELNNGDIVQTWGYKTNGDKGDSVFLIENQNTNYFQFKCQNNLYATPLTNLECFITYGGDPTNTNDNTSLITSLNNFNITTLFFPKGSYKFENVVTINNINIIGENKGSSLTFFNCTKFILKNQTNGRPMLIQNVHFTSTTPNETLIILGDNVTMDWGQSFYLKNVAFMNYNNTCMEIYSNFNTTINNCLFQNNGTSTNTDVVFTQVGSATGNNFSNVIGFKNTYFNGGANTKNATAIMLQNILDISFELCTFEWYNGVFERTGANIGNITLINNWYEQVKYVTSSFNNINRINDRATTYQNYVKDQYKISGNFAMSTGANLKEMLQNLNTNVNIFRDDLQISNGTLFKSYRNEKFLTYNDYRIKNKLDGILYNDNPVIYYDLSPIRKEGFIYKIEVEVIKFFNDNTSHLYAVGYFGTINGKAITRLMSSSVVNTNESSANKLSIEFQADGFTVRIIDTTPPDVYNASFTTIG